MQSDPYLEVAALGEEVRGELMRLDAERLQIRPDRGKATVGELIATALLELDRISSEPRVGLEGLPTFAGDFLNRRLTRRLLDRYQADELAAEFDRRLASAMEVLAKRSADLETGPMLERLRCALADLRSALVERDVPAAERPDR